MRILGNVIWVVFGGWFISLFNLLLGLFFLAIVVTAPIGLGLIQLSKFCLFPFTTALVSKSKMDIKQNKLWQAYSFIFKLIYVFPFGLISFILTLPVIALSFISIIAIPQAIAMSKALGAILNPIGKICVSRATGLELEKRKAKTEADKLLGVK